MLPIQDERETSYLSKAGATVIELLIEGEGSVAVQEISGLRNWLHEARRREVLAVTQQKRPPEPGELGPELLPILQVVLESRAIEVLLICIRDCFIARRFTMEITVERGPVTVRIKASNPPSTEELERIAKTLVDGLTRDDLSD